MADDAKKREGDALAEMRVLRRRVHDAQAAVGALDMQIAVLEAQRQRARIACSREMAELERIGNEHLTAAGYDASKRWGVKDDGEVVAA